MSKVYDIPRYKNQTLKKLRLHLDAFATSFRREQDGVNVERRLKVLQAFGNPDAMNISHEPHAYIDAFLDDSEIEMSQEYDDDTNFYRRYVADECFMRANRTNIDMYEVMRSYALVGELMTQLVIAYGYVGAEKIRTLWTDSQASFRLFHFLLDNKKALLPKMSQIQMTRVEKCRDLAQTATWMASVSCNHGKPVVDAIKVMASKELPEEYYCRKAVVLGMESLRMNSMTKDVRENMQMMRDHIEPANYAKTLVDHHEMYINLGLNPSIHKIHRIMFWYVIVTEFDIYVLDLPSVNQLHEGMKMWEGVYTYAMYYRMIGDDDKDNLLAAVEKSQTWMLDALIQTNYSEWLAANMRISVQKLQNEFHHECEPFEFGWREKDKIMQTLCTDQLKLSPRWHEFLQTLGLKKRTIMDLANLYYALPAPDGDLVELCKKFEVTMQDVNKVNPVVWDDFMSYAKMSITVHIIAKYGASAVKKWHEAHPDVETVPNWVHEASRGHATVPPRDQWHLSGIPGFLPYRDTVRNWYWEAGDVSRCEAHVEAYSDRERYYSLGREAHNELLYAMKHAPFLDYTLDPQQIWTSAHEYDNVTEISMKAENTKPAQKGREILAGCDITRVKLSDINTNAMAIGSACSGVTSNKPPIDMYQIENDLCHHTNVHSSAVVISNDIKSWSTIAPKLFWEKFIDMEMEFIKCPDGMKYSLANKDLIAVMRKRGHVMIQSINKCMQQGWTGECDTHFHFFIMAYAVRTAKEKGLLPMSAKARTATLIDDAVQGIRYDNNDSLRDNYDKIQEYVQHVIQTYNDLGAQLAFEKTIVSFVKWIFLNKFYCEGTELVLAMKIWARADRSYDRRTATIFEQCDTVYGGFYAAVTRGADPLAAYFCAAQRSFELIYQTLRRTENPLDVSSMSTTMNAFFAPRCLGGWGFPHIGGWVTQESRDDIVRYMQIITRTCQVLSSSGKRAQNRLALNMNRQMQIFLSQPFAGCSSIAFANTPFNVRSAGAVDPAGCVNQLVEMSVLRLVESNVFKGVMEFGQNANCEKALDMLLSNCQFDANVLQRLAMCMPSAVAREMMSRITKNELVQNLFPFRIRSVLARKLKKANEQALKFAFVIAPTSNTATTMILPSHCVRVASELRERFYKSLGYSLVNHTTGDPPTFYRMAIENVAHAFDVNIRALAPACPRSGENYANWYEAAAPGPLRKPVRSRGVLHVDKETTRHNDPLSACLLKLAAICYYASRKGADGKMLFNFFAAFWGAKTDVWQVSIGMKFDEKAKTVRLSQEHAVRDHQIACFPNARNAAVCVATDLARLLDTKKTLTDLISIIQSACAAMLIESAATKITDINAKYSFVLQEDALVSCDPIVFNLDQPTMSEALIAAARVGTPVNAFDALSRIILPGPNDPVIVGMVVDLSGPQADLADNDVGLFNAIAIGSAAPLITQIRRRYKTSHNPDTAGGQLPPHYSQAYRDIASKCNFKVRSAIALGMAAAVYYQALPNNPELTAPWNQVGEWWSENGNLVHFNSIILRTRELMANALLEYGVVKSMFRMNMHNHMIRCVKAICNYENPCSVCLPIICAQLYCHSKGRPTNPNIYYATAILGAEHLVAPYRSTGVRFGINHEARARMWASSVYHEMATNMIGCRNKNEWMQCLGRAITTAINEKAKPVNSPLYNHHALDQMALPQLTDDMLRTEFTKAYVREYARSNPLAYAQIANYPYTVMQEFRRYIGFILSDGYMVMEGAAALNSIPEFQLVAQAQFGDIPEVADIGAIMIAPEANEPLYPVELQGAIIDQGTENGRFYNLICQVYMVFGVNLAAQLEAGQIQANHFENAIQNGMIRPNALTTTQVWKDYLEDKTTINDVGVADVA